MIPKIIHFIHFGFTDFELIHYMSIKSALEVHQPDRVFLYYNKEPVNNKLWNEIKTRVELVKVDPPKEFGGVELKSYQYKADVLRLQKLIELGGAYMDIDVISLKSFDNFWSKSCVLGIESAPDHFSANLDNARSITNAVILAEPNHPFIVDWLTRTAENLKDKPWAYHAVCLPLEILKEKSYDVHVEPQNSFMPFDFNEGWLFGPVESKKNKLATSYTMHLWETIWHDKLNEYTVDKIKSIDNLFASICKKFLPEQKLKIAVYTIAKNESNFVDRWAASNTEADIRIVCDTGSTDDTVEKLKSHNVTVYPISVMPWRFDMARNTALNLVPADVDICIWQDLDEELLPGWRKELEKVWTSKTTVVQHRYRNNNHAWQWHSKVHARHNCLWTGAVHETLRWSVPEQDAWAPEFYLDEHQDTTKSRSSYLNLLLKKIEEGDKNWRTYYFLANDYQYAGDFENSTKYREMSYHAIAGDDLLQSYVARNLARQYADQKNNKLAEQWFRASVNHSNERESWFSYAEYLYHQQAWEECYIAAKKCIGISVKRDGFTYDGTAWGFLIYDYAAIAAYHIGLAKQAIEFGRKCVEMSPQDNRLQANLKFYEEMTNRKNNESS
jgi:mannosyltransferase OCH1-like enzyme